MREKGTEDEMLKSLHECLVSLATKVLPALTQKAQLHTQCFKALQVGGTQWHCLVNKFGSCTLLRYFPVSWNICSF